MDSLVGTRVVCPCCFARLILARIDDAPNRDVIRRGCPNCGKVIPDPRPCAAPAPVDTGIAHGPAYGACEPPALAQRSADRVRLSAPPRPGKLAGRPPRRVLIDVR